VSILVDKNTRLIVQGITGREGRFHTEQIVAYGTNVVGGVTPGKGGEWALGKPVFDTVKAAKESTGANASIIYVPAAFAADAIYEALDADIELIVCITEGIPVLDMMKVRARLDQSKSRLVGPNCPGLLTPDQANGTNFMDVLLMFEEDPQTEKAVLIGEIGGTDEERAARYIANYMTKPVVAFIAGQTAPPGKRMGHAGAIVEGGSGTAADKIAALSAAGVKIAEHPEQIPDLL
jgi:succinyl-CoA synthetase alpha subunit